MDPMLQMWMQNVEARLERVERIVWMASGGVIVVEVLLKLSGCG